MNVREHLEELDKYLIGLLNTGGGLLTDKLTVGQAQSMVERLIAERPYEPGDKIKVSDDENFVTEVGAEFYCVPPRGGGNCVVARRLDCGKARTWEYHRSIPKTITLPPVPVEIVEKARAVNRSSLHMTHQELRDKSRAISKWIAENVEAGDE